MLTVVHRSCKESEVLIQLPDKRNPNSSFEALAAVMFHVEVFWVVTPCSVVVRYQNFEGPSYLHLQGEGLVS
jgi:hypothetical protein